MKNLVALLTLPFLFLAGVSEWKPVKLSEKITVSMPAEPIDEVKNGINAKKLKMEDEGELIGSVNNLSDKGLTADMLQQMIESGTLSEQIKGSIASQGGTILNFSEGQYKNIK